MGIDGIVERIYGPKDDPNGKVGTYVTGMIKTVLIPGGIIVHMDRLLKQEETRHGPNTPRRIFAMGSAVVTDVVKTGMYVAIPLLSYYNV